MKYLRWARWTSESRLLLASIIAGSALLAVLSIAAWQFSQLQNSLEAQSRLSDAAFAGRDRLLQIVNEETGVRGYVATGNAVYLDIYYGAGRALNRDQSIRRRSLVDEDAATAQAAQAVQRYFRQQIARVRAGRLGQARQRLAHGKALLDRLRSLDAADERATQRQVAAQRARTRFLAAAGESGAIALCVLVVCWTTIFAYVLRRSTRYRLSLLRDALTGAQNRQGAIVAIDAQIGAVNPRPFGLIFIDLDGFKKINDVYGHAAGDEILRMVASRLRAELRSSDSVCRLGGDEFLCVVASPVSFDELRAVASRLSKAVGRPYDVDRDTYVVGCSMGVSMYPQHGNSAESLLARADSAMYVAKAAGGGVREASAAAQW